MAVAAKICGVRDRPALRAAVGGGAAAVGFVFVPASPRAVDPMSAAALARDVPSRVSRVGLFVDAGDPFIEEVVEAVPLDVLQLHGRESPERVAAVRARFGLGVWKALPVSEAGDPELAAAYRGSADRILFDARAPEGAALPGGNARPFDWTLLGGLGLDIPWILSGGLDPDNVGEAVRVSGAGAVDVSSGVERTRGVKDPALIRTFLAAVGNIAA